jgi:protein-L-isoaspartate O-methyltransferase
MVSRDRRRDEPRLGFATGVFSTGLVAMAVVCCGGQALVLAGVGALAFGSVLGWSAAVLAAVVLVGAVLAVRRRRRAAASALRPREGAAS